MYPSPTTPPPWGTLFVTWFTWSYSNSGFSLVSDPTFLVVTRPQLPITTRVAFNAGLGRRQWWPSAVSEIPHCAIGPLRPHRTDTHFLHPSVWWLRILIKRKEICILGISYGYLVSTLVGGMLTFLTSQTGIKLGTLRIQNLVNSNLWDWTLYLKKQKENM